VQTTADASSLRDNVPSSSSEPFTVNLHAEYFHSHLCDTPSLELSVTKEQLVSMYSQMVQMRRMEMAADQLYKQKLIRGFCHLAIGQVSLNRFFSFLLLRG
jgi:pyruvate dehydrogenase E1 component alpha subunit